MSEAPDGQVSLKVGLSDVIGMARGLALAAAILLPCCVAAAPMNAPLDSNSATKAEAPGVRPIRIVAFGSSSTEGVGASTPANAYPAKLGVLLQRALGTRPLEVINNGIGGEDIDDMIVRLQRDVLDLKPDLVIWQLGSNDPLRNVPLDRFEGEMRAALSKFRKAGVHIMLMEPQWCPRLEGATTAVPFRDRIRAIAQELDLPLVRRFDLMQRWTEQGLVRRDQLLSADGLHMTDQSYALLAQATAEEILGDKSSLLNIAPLEAAVRK